MATAVPRHVRQAGAVLIGDAYQTSCPAAGTGVSRLLTDIECLLEHARDWFDNPGMGGSKITAYYDDADKQAMDSHAIGLADYRRSFTIDKSAAWQARR